MELVLLGVGAIGFIGYLIWLIVCIRNWDSKIPPIIGMLLSLVMVVGGLSFVFGFDDILQSKKSNPSDGGNPSIVAPSETVNNLPPTKIESEGTLSEHQIKEMYSNPSKYKNEKVVLTGMVFGTVEYDSDDVYFQMWADPDTQDLNTVVKYSGSGADLEDGTYIRISGTVYGTFEGENAFGAKITAPQIEADNLEIISYQDAAAPTLYTLIPEEPTQVQLGYSVTVEKVELAEKETRVYVKVENNGSDKFNVYSFNSILLQNGQQYNEETNYSADYPTVQTELRPGVSTEGIFCYPAIKNQSFQVIIDGSTENYEEHLESYQFDIVV